jgi:uncharacterized protein YecT (DUF1311 family)
MVTNVVSCRLCALLSALLLACVSALNSASAIEWPKGFVTAEGSTSPDGRFGVLIPGRDSAPEDYDASTVVNYLANLKTHRVLGKIKGGDYWQGENHAGLIVQWSADSTYCVVQYDARYGFDKILAVEPTDSKLIQANFSDRVNNATDAVIRKQAHDSEASGDCTPYFRLGADRKIHVRALSSTNPKRFEDVKTYFALFQGTYDFAEQRWTVTDARSITEEQSEALEGAYGEQFDGDESYPNLERKAEALDERLNNVYQAARVILSPDRFALVKQEQIAWLKKRDAAGSKEEQCKLVEARIKALRDLVW